MKTSRAVFFWIFSILVSPLACQASATFVVTNRANVGPGTLRQAILDSNGTLFTTPNTITFNLPATGALPMIISASTALPAITRPVQILGDTQPGSAGYPGQPVVEIGGPYGGGTAGLVINTTNCTIRRLAIWGFDNEGILIQGGGGHLIVGNHIGVNTNDIVLGVGNGTGITVSASFFNVIGGTAPHDRNVISQNKGHGIYLANSCSSNTVMGNFVGLSMSGTTARANGDSGIYVEGDYNVIGGNVAGAGNVVSGNSGNMYASAGINIDGDWGDRAAGNRVQGNLIGTDVTGTIAIPNQNGIRLESSEQTLIGGSTAAERNVISGNMNNGIITAIYPFAAIGARDTVISGNYIGTDKSGTAPIPNAGQGIYAYVLADSNILIGGTNSPGEANVIAYNGLCGVGVLDGTGTAILRNSIFLNGQTHTNNGLGIDLGMDNVTLNDTGDPDTGGNMLQNFPVLTGATSDGINITITGKLNTEPSRQYRLQFFRNDTCDPTGYGEGQRYIGQQFVTTDAFGGASFTATFPLTSSGNIITATATSPEGNTSEFCKCRNLVFTPVLTIVRTGDHAVISWPAGSGSSWMLQESPMTSPPVWTDVPVTPTLSGGYYVVSIPIGGTGHIYRLRAS